MKRYIYGTFLMLFLFLFSGCGEQGNILTGSSVGNSWYVGHGQAEIALPEDTETDEPLYIAGYHGGEEIAGVLDMPCANAVWMGTDADSGILLLGVDCVGLGSDTVYAIRSRLADFSAENGCQRVFVYATHTHAGIDTLGLWGPTAVDGKNRAYMENLISSAVSAAEAAYVARKCGALYFGAAETEGLQEDSRAPYVYDETLYQLRFVPKDDSAGTRIVFFAAHAESLRGDNRLLSRDFPGVMADTIRAETGDGTLFVPGAIGGLVMTPVLLDESTADGDPDFYIKNCTATGKALAACALSISPDDETAVLPSYAFAETEYAVPLDNTVFLYYRFLGILGNPLTRNSDSETGYALHTSCAALRLGDSITIAMLPGEIFPELVYSDTEFSAAGVGYALTDETFPSLSALAEEYGMGTLLIAGLCGDETGYILPPGDYLVNPDLPYFEGAEDDSGENHYEETNSAGIRAAQCLAEAMENVFRAVGK